MKRLINFLLFIFIFSYASAAEKLLDVTYEQTQDKNFVVNIKPNQAIKSYTTKNGTLIQKGTKLTIGKALEGNLITVQNQGLFGSSKNTTTKAVFATITVGTFAGSVAGSMFGGTVPYLLASQGGEEVVVEDINLAKTTAKKQSPRFVRLFVVNNTDGAKIVSGRTIADLERALRIGEVVDPNKPLDKSGAIAKLKEAKELLELEIMSQEEYDQLKAKLTVIIRGG